MGILYYGTPAAEFTFDDRVLAHLQVVFSAKLRRHESFFFSWTDGVDLGSGRRALWVSDSIPLYFRFNGSRAPLLNRQWLDELAASAASTQGLVLGEEPVMAEVTA
ncbi:ATP-dependent DNA ligase [Glaciibacter flavus]|uniref:ATP-dependent DNA ligase n=1 Tax=Orlajensenia flava TaxID=2565934 RepID=A0A4S4FQ87_9MICO|nr:ATP-dependent DNA ligase [Glaciibacter flavus]THG32451.1 ATP-dependent DNA ligase [Glaciibacter flavus]